MFLILLHYTQDLAEIDRLIPAHREFLQQQYAQGNFLLSGRKEPRTGGVILARGTSRQEIERIVHNDPFHRAGVAEYQIVEFVPTMSAPPFDAFKVS